MVTTEPKTVFEDSLTLMAERVDPTLRFRWLTKIVSTILFVRYCRAFAEATTRPDESRWTSPSWSASLGRILGSVESSAFP